MSDRRRFRAAVIVVGDIARSPRMMYHAEALARDLAEVDLIGRSGQGLPEAVVRNPRIRCRPLPGPPRKGVVRAIREFFGLLRLAFAGPGRWDLMLLQAPPAFPAVWALEIARRFRGGSIVIDWHNFGAPLLRLRGGPAALAASALAQIETSLARAPFAQLCVSRAMRCALVSRGARRPPSVFYDRAHERFRAADAAKRRALREELSVHVGGIPPEVPIVISPTSWTRDEDHPLLLRALDELDRIVGPGRPMLAILLTGHGDERAHFEAALRRCPPQRSAVATIWFEADDYFRLLGAADAGLCLHRSASGVDLPMKLADLRGSGLPVLVLRSSEALPEVFDPDADGEVFEDAGELARLLEAVSDPRSPLAAKFSRIRAESGRRSCPTWQQGWEREARPVIEEAIGAGASR